MFEAFVAITAAILGGMAQGAVSLIAVRNPSIREWANHKSPTYMIVISSVVTAFVFSLLFVVYLEYRRRQEIIFLEALKENALNATTEANIAANAGQNWYQCNSHSKLALHFSKDRLLPMANDRLNYRINNLLP